MAEHAEMANTGRCGKCKLDVRSEEQGVCCDGCQWWYHIRCATIEVKLYVAMMKYNTTEKQGLYWYCEKCNVDVKEWKSEVQKVRVEMLNLTQQLNTVKKEIKDASMKSEQEVKKQIVKILQEMGLEKVKDQVEILRKESEETKRDMGDNLNNIKLTFSEIVQQEMDKTNNEGNKINKLDRKDLQMEVSEGIDRVNRRDNLVLMGVPEEGEDGKGDEIVKDVVGNLLPGVRVEFTVMERIGRKGLGPRPLRIKVKDMSHKRKLLMKARELKGHPELHKIYVVPDLTRLQQLEDKKLRDQVKEMRKSGVKSARIMRGEIVREGRNEDNGETEGARLKGEVKIMGEMSVGSDEEEAEGAVGNCTVATSSQRK